MDMRQTIAMASGRVNLNFLRGCEKFVMGLFSPMMKIQAMFATASPLLLRQICSYTFVVAGATAAVWHLLAKIDNHIPEGYNPRWFIGDKLDNPTVTFN